MLEAPPCTMTVRGSGRKEGIMPKYQVLRPIEHNQVLYLPRVDDAPGSTSLTAPSESRGATVKSVSHGRDIPVNPSGVIELTEQEAAPFDMGQVEKVAEAVDAKKKPEKK